MDRIDAMRLFLRVADAGSFSRAAADLSIGQPTVSRRIQDLEQDLAGLNAEHAVRQLRSLREKLQGLTDVIERRLNAGELVIYDYKTGAVPSPKQVENFDRQLLIEAVMAEAGAFDGLPAETVQRGVHLHLGRSPKDSDIALAEAYETVTVSAELTRLLTAYSDESTGYVSRRAMEKVRYDGDYDHLARFGEWDATARTKPRPVR